MRKSQNWRPRLAVGSSSSQKIETDISKSARLDIVELRKAWVARFGEQAPSIRSRHVLRRMFAWKIQAAAFGGLDVATCGKLHEIAAALERDGVYEPKIMRDLSPGVVLTREWKGTTHKVTVTADGFQHESTTHRSLSDVARAITGTRWSGPRFFGLERRSSPAKGAPRP